MKTVITVTGATGNVGRVLTERLLAAASMSEPSPGIQRGSHGLQRKAPNRMRVISMTRPF